MEKIPTAEEFAERNQYDIQSYDEGGYLGIDTKVFAEKLIEFAKLHVEAALEQALYNAEINDFDEHEQYSPCIDGPSILNAYPLDNIK